VDHSSVCGSKPSMSPAADTGAHDTVEKKRSSRDTGQKKK
jgi:hypothetical protein